MAWKPLQFSSSAGTHLSPFLISSEFDNDSYLVRLTDLTNTWVERLDRDAIIERSREDNTSIDPSEDDDQLSIFLDRIKLGLAVKKDTGTSLEVGTNIGGDALPDLLLHVKVPLPGGLKDLQWRYQLRPQSPKETAHALVLPSLVALQTKRKGVDELVALLGEKDAIIQKLVDTVENQGTDLGTVFHQTAGRPGRRVDRKMASEKVNGLKIFDEDSWRRGLGSDETGHMWSLLNSVFSDEDISSNLFTTNCFDEEAYQSDWWDHMHGKTVGIVGNEITTSPKDLPKKNTNQGSIPPEDDFQVQSTLPHLSRSNPKPDISMDDSTEDDEDDDDDLDAPSQHSRTPSQDADDITEDDEPLPSNSRSTDTIENDINDNDTTKDDAIFSPPSKCQQAPQKSPSPKSPPAKKKGKLGKLGGKKASSPSPMPELAPEDDSQIANSRPKRGMLCRLGGKKRETTSTPEVESQGSASSKKKLGMIGGKKAAAGSASHGEETRGRAIKHQTEDEEKTQETNPPLRETSQERADKKREMLKRELEAKSKAPVKKKRKF